MNERPEYAPRRTQVVVLEDEDDLAGLIQLWLARHGLRTVPIDGETDAAPQTPSGSSPYPNIHVVGGSAEAELPETAIPSVVIVADAAGAGPDGGPFLVDVNRRHFDLEAWADALRAGSQAGERDHIRLGPLDISSARRSVRVSDADVHLTPTEFRLLCYLVQHADRVVGHSELLHSVWGAGYEEDIHLLQVTIRSLRARIELVTDRPLIELVYGVGYRMATCPVDDSQGA